jgi:hypothetical protein
MPIQLVLRNLPIQSISMHTKDLCGPGLISTRLGERGLNELLLELAYGFIQINTPFDHFRYKGFQLLFH